jgi:hypothetical protein
MLQIGDRMISDYPQRSRARHAARFPNSAPVLNCADFEEQLGRDTIACTVIDQCKND